MTEIDKDKRIVMLETAVRQLLKLYERECERREQDQKRIIEYQKRLLGIEP